MTRENAEKILIAGILLEGKATHMAALRMAITRCDFKDTRLGMIHWRLVRMYLEGKGFEWTTLAEELKAHGEMEHVGGFAFISEIAAIYPSKEEVNAAIVEISPCKKKRN